MGLFDHLVDIPLAADLTREEARSLVLVFLASALGAILSRWHLRVVLPTVVVEIVLGILIGPEGLDIATSTTTSRSCPTSASRCSSSSPGSR